MFNKAAAIGADIGRNLLRMAVVRANGEIAVSHEVRLDRNQTRDYLLSVFIQTAGEMRLKAAASGINPICIGIAAKGFIDHKSGVIIGPDHGIRDWKNVPLARITYESTGLPAFVGNDANMMTLAEHQFGAARGFRDVVFVALRSGIGGGIIIGGNLYRGVNDAGGEFGQMIVNCDNGVSELGIKGSWEHLASASALARRYAESKGLPSAELRCRDIIDMYRKGLPDAVAVVRENAELVGIGLANLISVFAPQIIILGGGMTEAGDDYISMIKASAAENTLETLRNLVRIEKASLGSSASLMGSAYYALVRLAGKTI